MTAIGEWQTVLTETLNMFDLQTDVQIVQIKPELRLILAYDQDPGKPNVANHLIKVERAMKVRTGNKMLELLCESATDKNRRDIKSGRIAPKMVSARNVESLD